MRLGKIGFEPQSLMKIIDGLGGSPLLGQGQTQVVMSFRGVSLVGLHWRPLVAHHWRHMPRYVTSSSRVKLVASHKLACIFSLMDARRFPNCFSSPGKRAAAATNFPGVSKAQSFKPT